MNDAMIWLLVAFLAGFALAMAIMRDGSREPRSVPAPLPSNPVDCFGEEVENAIAQRYEPTTLAIAENVYLSGVEEGIGGRLAPEGVASYRERGRLTCKAAARDMGIAVSCAFAEGVAELRNGLATRTGLDDPEMLEQATRAALGRG